MTDAPEADAPPAERLEMGRLETGWQPDTAVTDTLLRQYVTANAEWMESVARASNRPVMRTDDVLAVDEHSDHLLFSVAPQAGDQVIQDQVGNLGRLGFATQPALESPLPNRYAQKLKPGLQTMAAPGTGDAG